MWLFYYFNFERNYEVLKSKSPGILLSENINFYKKETESKMENRGDSFRERNPVLSAHVRIANYKKEILSQCVGYWTHFQNIYILLRIKKYYFIYFCCLFLKSSKAFSVSLNRLGGVLTSLWSTKHVFFKFHWKVCKIKVKKKKVNAVIVINESDWQRLNNRVL